jgi:multiple sugar transport system ATP-binding protein
LAEIVIRDLRKEFGDFVAVRESTFTIGDGEFFMLLGPSGCGKTTTLRMIAGLELPTSGQILLDGQDVAQVPADQRDIAFVFQMFALYPHMNVRRNIGYPLVSQGVPRAEVRRRVEEVARILAIADILDRPVGGLSGGDRQRVALGRAIVRQPKAFLMDEPLGALDAEFREHMAGELRALHDRMRATTVYVTHDQLEAMQMGDKIVVMNHGVVEQWGTPQEIYDRPASIFVADFIGSPPMNLLRFEATFPPGAEAVRLAGVTLPIPPVREGVSGRALALGVRPEHVRLGDGPLRGEIEDAEYLGTTQIVTVRTAGGALKARVPASVRLRTGETVGLGFDTATLSLFDAGTGRALPLDRAAARAAGARMAAHG